MVGDVFASIAVREPQPRASEAFRLFGEQHRNMERIGHEMLQNTKPVSDSHKILMNIAKLCLLLFSGAVRLRNVFT